MNREQETLERLASALARKVRRHSSQKPRLQVVQEAAAGRYDAITRQSVLARIRFLSRAYRLRWLVEQETFNQPSLENLTDDALAALLRDMERARECIAEGITFEDAGLVRSTAAALPEPHDDGWG